MPLQLFQVSQFAGINARISKFLISDQQSQDNLNLSFTEGGALTKLPGYAKWNAVSLGAFPMLGGARYYKTGAVPQFIEVNNGIIYSGNDSTQTFTQVATGFNTTATWAMVVYRDLLFMLNGTDINQKWNGTTVTRMGLVAPTTAPTAALGAAGNLNGVYTWGYTFVSATQESNVSPFSNSLTAANQQVSLTGIAVSTDTQVTKRRIYRTLAGGSLYFFVAEIADNITTTFTDNIADSALGANMPLFMNPPVINKFIEMYKNRLWIAGDVNNPRRLYFSEIFAPEQWPVTYFVDIPMSPGDNITGLKVLGDVLVVYGHNTPFLVIGESPFDFIVKRSFAQVGAESYRTIALVENAHIYLSRFGIYAFDGAVSRLISDELDPLIRNQNPTYFLNGAAAYHEKKKLYRVALTSNADGTTTNAREYVYDLRRGAWFRTDRTIAYYHQLDGPGDTGRLFSASPTAGFIYEEDGANTVPQTETADGAALNVSWTSKAYALGPVDFTKFPRHILVWLLPNLDNITLSVTADDDTSRQQTWTIVGGSSALPVYGTAIYGSAIYGGPGIVRIANLFNQNMRGRYFTIQVQAAANNPLKIYSIEISYRSNPNLRIR